MIVGGSKGIAHLATHVRDEIFAQVSEPFVATNLRFTAMCLDLIAEDYDRAADTLVADRADLVAIFEQARTCVAGALQVRLAERLAVANTGLRVSALTLRADSDMRVLIDLHTAVAADCGAGRDGAAALDARIWRFIRDYAARRAYVSPI